MAAPTLQGTAPEPNAAPIFASDPLPAGPRRAAVGVAVIVIGLMVTVVAFMAVRQSERSRIQAEFEQRAQGAAQFVLGGLQRHQDSLYAMRNLFHFSADVDRAKFSGAASELIARQVGVRALEWIRRVPEAERAATEAAVKAEGFPDFEFRERASDNALRRTPPRSEYFPVTYIEPMAGNELALGFDLASGMTWPVLERIAGTGELAATGRLPLLTASKRPDWGYVMELPVYAQPLTAKTPAERRARLRGYVLGIFALAQTLESFFEKLPEEEDMLEILFLDRSAKRELQFLHFHSKGITAADAAEAPGVGEFQSSMHVRFPVIHAGRQWEMWFRPRQDWIASHGRSRSWLALALGLVITGAAGSYAFGALRRERLVSRLVAERTAELRATQAALEQDVRERRESERQLRMVISQLPGAAFRCLFDEKLSMQFASDGMLQLTGYSSDDFTSGRVHMNQLAVLGDGAATRAKVAAAVEKRVAFEVEFRIRHQNGSARWLLVRGWPVSSDDGALRFVEGLAIDITPLKAAESQKLAMERKLLETQKLESLGVLAGGIAHDFNNLLTAMLANASLARFTLPAGGQSAEHLEQIEQAARRAADLCQQMLAYAGKRELRPRPLSLTELVRSTAALLRVSIPKKVRFDLRLDDRLPAVLGDAAQLQQIVMNLFINASDAIGDKSGEIVVSTALREMEASFLRTAVHSPDLPGGSYVMLEVRDNGCGMSPETLARIFEPFFTTKFSGRGLGLAAVMGIVQSHRGALFVETEKAVGSTFRLYLQANSAPLPVPVPPARKVDAVKLKGTTLVVDDEESVLQVLGTLLRRHGMDPILASSGEEALRLYDQRKASVDLVILDLTMPGLSGEDTLRALRERNRRQRVVLMSGYSERDTIGLCSTLGVEDFIAKPFELPTLLEKLQTVAN